MGSNTMELPRANDLDPQLLLRQRNVDLFDPFKAVRPSAFNDHRPGYPSGATPIERPENTDWTTPRAPRALFMSNGAAPKPSNASKNLQAFIDLTKDDSGSFKNQMVSTSFGEMDVYGYVDSEKATENIKALLEGAFEDEEDQSHQKSKSKKRERRRRRSSSSRNPRRANRAIRLKPPRRPR